MSNNYVIPVHAIKHILEKEHKEFKNAAYLALRKSYMNDATLEFVNIASDILLTKLNECQNYEDLDEFIGFAGYRMSLQEWINSL